MVKFPVHPGPLLPSDCVSEVSHSLAGLQTSTVMGSKAPGQAATEQEAVCYNCGVKGHWAFACPEPTRDVPV